MATFLEWAVMSLAHLLFPDCCRKILCFFVHPHSQQMTLLVILPLRNKSNQKRTSTSLPHLPKYQSVSASVTNSYLPYFAMDKLFSYFRPMFSTCILDCVPFHCLKLPLNLFCLCATSSIFLYWIISINILECYYFFHLNKTKQKEPLDSTFPFRHFC